MEDSIELFKTQTGYTYRAELPVIKKKFVYITNSGLALHGLCFIKETGSVSWNQYDREFTKYTLFKLLTEKKIFVNDDKFLCIHNMWSSGYHHWVCDVLIKLCELGEKTKEYTLVLPANYPDFAKESIRAFPLKKIIYLAPKTGVFAKTATFIGNPRSGYFHPEKIQILKNHLLSYSEKKNDGSQKGGNSRIYISRESAKLRRIINEKEVIEVLKKKGFIILKAETLSFWEQVDIFKNCKYLVSIHGAGLTNMLFMDRGARVMELVRKPTEDHPYFNLSYFHMTKALGLQYFQFHCNFLPNEPNIPLDRRDMIVNIERFEMRVDKFLE